VWQYDLIHRHVIDSVTRALEIGFPWSPDEPARGKMSLLQERRAQLDKGSAARVRFNRRRPNNTQVTSLVHTTSCARRT
jgi:hypothetical protein